MYHKYDRLPSVRQEDDLDEILRDIVTGLQVVLIFASQVFQIRTAPH